MNKDKYTWFGIEKPFPWALIVLSPIGLVYELVAGFRKLTKRTRPPGVNANGREHG